MKNKSIRKIKIQYKYRPYGRYKYYTVPSIILSGKWLLEAGFQIGEYIEITVYENCFIIRKSKQSLDE